ncbi:hypothetical protein V8E54_014918, partial [Elaphomyces granulatus]
YFLFLLTQSTLFLNTTSFAKVVSRFLTQPFRGGLVQVGHNPWFCSGNYFSGSLSASLRLPYEAWLPLHSSLPFTPAHLGK